MAQGDPNFAPTSKGAFAIDPRGYPKRHRMVAGRVITEELIPRPKDDYEDISELMAGLSSSDLRGPASGFGRHVTANYKDSAAGSGDPDETIRRGRGSNYENGYGGGGDPPIDQGWETTEDVGDSDMFGQPQEGHAPEEFGDFLDDIGDETEPSSLSPNDHDEEDIWDTSNYEPFTENRNRGRQSDDPTFTGRPHRQREAVVSDDLADELDGLFDSDSVTFNRRGL